MTIKLVMKLYGTFICAISNISASYRNSLKSEDSAFIIAIFLIFSRIFLLFSSFIRNMPIEKQYESIDQTANKKKIPLIIK